MELDRLEFFGTEYKIFRVIQHKTFQSHFDPEKGAGNKTNNAGQEVKIFGTTFST